MDRSDVISSINVFNNNKCVLNIAVEWHFFQVEQERECHSLFLRGSEWECHFFWDKEWGSERHSEKGTTEALLKSFGKSKMTFAALLFTFSWNVVSGQSMTTPVSSTVLKKCCPEGQTFSTQQLGCQDLVYDDPQLAQHDTLKPALLSDLSGITNDSMRMDYVLETGSVGNDAIPRCDNITQQLTYLLHAGNDPNKAEYAILDLQNKKNRRPFWLVDLSEKEAVSYGSCTL